MCFSFFWLDTLYSLGHLYILSFFLSNMLPVLKKLDMRIMRSFQTLQFLLCLHFGDYKWITSMELHHIIL